jgi:hypothetical protein
MFKQPLGFIVPGLEHKLCKLKKTLYGLCQSPWAWHERIYILKKKTNLVPCLADPNLYIFQEDGLILAIYVDDLMLIGSHNAKLEWVRDEFCSQFDMSLLGLLALYLGA